MEKEEENGRPVLPFVAATQERSVSFSWSAQPYNNGGCGSCPRGRRSHLNRKAVFGEELVSPRVQYLRYPKYGGSIGTGGKRYLLGVAGQLGTGSGLAAATAGVGLLGTRSE